MVTSTAFSGSRRPSRPCLQCGRDLANVRARREPVYGFFIMRCDRCGTVAVTRRPEQRRRRRRARHVTVAVLTLAAQLALTFGLVIVTTAFCVEIAKGINHVGGWPHRAGERALLIGGAIVLPVTLGMWFRLGFAHWRRGVAPVVFAVIVAGLCSFETVVGPLLAKLVHLGIGPGAHREFGLRVLVLVGVMTVALLGLPVSAIAVRLHRAAERAIWRRRRRRRQLVH